VPLPLGPETRGPNNRCQDGAATDFPLNAAIPNDQTCTGTVAGQDNVCLVRCQNAARAGPFGGVIPVQMATGGNATAGAAAARFRLARAVRRDLVLLKKVKRAIAFKGDLTALDADEIAELEEDGEI
jgi:hypothetical protein